MAEPMTTHKLMILAMLDQVEMPLPYTVLADFFLLSEYSHYFAMQEALAELLEQNFIRKKEAPNDTRYEITGEGKKLLHTLSNKLTDGIYEDIKKYLREHQIQIREVTDLKANYYATSTGGIEVHLLAKDHSAVTMDVKLHVPNSDIAVAICENWKSCHEQVYAAIMDELVK
ncbi:MAG: DUF4364 family protein [Lachnospiraceae bacterium]|nr:DUF4364 family protein [Lachnospiraceae bacterium]